MPLAFSVCGKFKSCVAIDGNFSVPLAKNTVESIAQKRGKLSITKNRSYSLRRVFVHRFFEIVEQGK